MLTISAGACTTRDEDQKSALAYYDSLELPARTKVVSSSRWRVRMAVLAVIIYAILNAAATL